MSNLDIYCVTNKIIPSLEKTNYKIGWVGTGTSPSNYLNCDTGDNIFYKEKFYSELTFQYWFWKIYLILIVKNGLAFVKREDFGLMKNLLMLK